MCHYLRTLRRRTYGVGYRFGHSHIFFFLISLFSSKRKKASDHDVDTSKSDAESVPIATSNAGVAKGDNPDSGPIPRSWIWRILKCSQCCCFVLVCLQVVLVCVEYFLKPNCCETTLSTLLSPTWSRDPKGPPPVWADIRQVYARSKRKISTPRINDVFGEKKMDNIRKWYIRSDTRARHRV